MQTRHRWTLLVLFASLAIVLAPGATTTAGAQATGAAAASPPTVGQATDIALAYVRANAAALGLTPADVADLLVSDAYQDAHSGVTHVYLRQKRNGLGVADANATVNVGRDGAVISAPHHFIRNLNGATSGAFELGAAASASAAATQLGLEPTEPIRPIDGSGGLAHEVELSDGGIAEDAIPARLVYQALPGGDARLAWNVEIEEVSGDHFWSATVDAETGELLATEDYVIEDDVEATAAAVATSDVSDAAAALGAVGPPATVAEGSSYRVYAHPIESPNDGPRTLVENPADALASPFGWHDTNGVAGAEFTNTRGNNVFAYTDVDDNNTPDPGSDPNGGPGLDFDFPIDFAQNASAYRPAAVTNLFYWNNIIHDVLYRYGFTEQAGNYQANNYGRGGNGNDFVLAEGQDGDGTNNANFSSGGADGAANGRMQMFIWNYGRPNWVRVDAPNPVAGTYESSNASFGPALSMTTPLTGEFAAGSDGAGVSPTDGCEPLVGFPAGRIALLDRSANSVCNFPTRVKNAQNAGAIAVVIVNNAAGNPAALNGTDATITIPSTMIAQAAGNALKANLPATGALFRDPVRGVTRDGDLDAGIMAHEYGHGVSNRLTGGPLTTGCLSGQEQMGEGWSDWQAVSITALASDTGPGRRGVGDYALWQATRHDLGIRPTAYSTDMTINPSTYDTIKTAAVPHGVGYVWNSMLWELYWNLVDKYGFNPNVYDAWNTGGNNLGMQLVMDGMKSQVCDPGFVDGRDGILAADVGLTGGANKCLIWRGFAKRGLGYGAVQGASSSRSDGVQAFDTHPDCRPQASVAPGSLSRSLVEGAQTTAGLTVSNDALVDGNALTWTVTEAASSCAAPSNLGWVSTAPTSGTTAADAASSLTVTFDATGLTAPSLMTGKLCLASNDAGRPTIEVPLTLQVQYPFGGFFSPLGTEGSEQTANAGSARPVKFSLGGNRGLAILAAGSPTSRAVDCTTHAPLGASSPTSTSGSSVLTYDPSDGTYVYVWKTSKRWAGTCRQLTVTLVDASEHVVYLRFS